MARLIRVLSLDGGGIRGIIPGTVLTALEAKLRARCGDQARVADFFDLVAGTSTGSILAAGLLMPDGQGRPKYTAEELVEIYLRRGPELMARPWTRYLGTLGGLLSAKYTEEGLGRMLDEYFGEMRLSELLRPTLITAYEIELRRAWFFRQHRAKERGDAYDFLVRDAVRSSAAAPTLFTPHRIQASSGHTFSMVDGGLFANNPALCAYAEVRRAHPRRGARDMVMLSLGTGEVRQPYHYKRARHWGMLQWVRPLLDISLGAGQSVVDFELKQIFSSVDCADQYLRITTADFPAGVSHSMEDVRQHNLRGLQEVGERLALQWDEDLERFADLLVEAGGEGEPVAF